MSHVPGVFRRQAPGQSESLAPLTRTGGIDGAIGALGEDAHCGVT